MARRHTGGAPAVSLFPFLSILACVIGVLTLLITALAISQLDPQAVQRVEAELREQEQRAQRFAALTEREASEQQNLQRLQEEIAAIQQRKRRVAELEKQEKALEAQLQKLAEQRKENTQMLAVSKALAQEMEAAEKRRTELNRELAQMREELAQREAPPEPPKVVVRPGGSGVDLEPTFVECQASQVVIHKQPKPVAVKRGDLAKSDVYMNLVNRVAEADKATIVFLLRSDGVGTYYTARNLARQNYARNGKLPIVGKGEIDLSLFRQGG